MRRVILFGATGNLGKEIAKELIKQGYDLTVVVRNELKAKSLCGITKECIVADACSKVTLDCILDKQDVVVSALGKSVSPNVRGKPTFREVDYYGNSNILSEAMKAGTPKFIYVSAFHSERYLYLEYFKAHHDFSELLKASGINYSIIKPPALFSAFIDMIEMAKKGQLVNIGNGEKKTNPIFEGDLAKIVVDSIERPNYVVEAGGKTIYTRRELNEIIQHEADKSKRLRTIPLGLFKWVLPVLRLFSKNAYDKFAFFTEVMQHDTIAPQLGTLAFEDYVKLKVDEQRNAGSN